MILEEPNEANRTPSTLPVQNEPKSATPGHDMAAYKTKPNGLIEGHLGRAKRSQRATGHHQSRGNKTKPTSPTNLAVQNEPRPNPDYQDPRETKRSQRDHTRPPWPYKTNPSRRRPGQTWLRTKRSQKARSTACRRSKRSHGLPAIINRAGTKRSQHPPPRPTSPCKTNPDRTRTIMIPGHKTKPTPLPPCATLSAVPAQRSAPQRRTNWRWHTPPPHGAQRSAPHPGHSRGPVR